LLYPVELTGHFFVSSLGVATVPPNFLIIPCLGALYTGSKLFIEPIAE